MVGKKLELTNFWLSTYNHVSLYTDKCSNDGEAVFTYTYVHFV